MAGSERLICASADLQDGGDGVRFSVDGGKLQEPAFVVRFRGIVYAYRNRCAHVPVELDWQPGRFFDSSGLYLICAMHGALYAPESGRCLAGPCKHASLSSLKVIERDGQVFLEEQT